MVWRLTRKQFEAGKSGGNRDALHGLVVSGVAPGVLAYLDGQPAGWCAVAPREHYPALARSRILKPVDGQPVWSVSCLFVDRRHRCKGVSIALLHAAAGFVRERGGTILEGYPIEPGPGRKLPAVFAWVGLASAFRQAGFEQVQRNSPGRPIMRRYLT
jgi:GNAT superfamily N-acetyltransferase